MEAPVTQKNLPTANCPRCLQVVVELAEEDIVSMDAALAPPALALALREFPASMPPTLSTDADVALCQVIMRAVRCVCSTVVARTRMCCEVGVGCVVVFVLEGYTPRGPPVQKFACGQADKRGFGNSFQPAIVASRFDLINCDIAPSAKMLFDCVHTPPPAGVYDLGDTLMGCISCLTFKSALQCRYHAQTERGNCAARVGFARDRLKAACDEKRPQQTLP